MTAKKKAPEPPKFGDLIKIGSAGGWEGIPDGPNPFYVGARDGLYQHRRNLLGRGVTKLDHWPTTFPKTDLGPGMFDFDADPIPKELMGQVVAFFEYIYDYQHTEAAVLLLMHHETKEWRIFVPTQMLSHGGVNYVFDPTHIKFPWVVVGSIHSHCDFGAGHSGTDTGDAAGFDGLHCTIGMIKRPIPQIVAMIAMNKKNFHYKEDQFYALFDFSEPKQHDFPKFWLRYCENTKEHKKPVGFELFAKFGKDAKVKNEHGTTIRRVPDSKETKKEQRRGWRRNHEQNQGPDIKIWVYDDVKKTMVRDVTAEAEIVGASGTNYGKAQDGLRPIRVPFLQEAIQQAAQTDEPDEWVEFYRLQGMEEPPEGYAGYSPRELLASGYSWDPDDKTWHWTAGANRMMSESLLESQRFNQQRVRDYDDLIRDDWRDDRHWEEILPPEVLGLIMESELVNEDDLEFAMANPIIAGDTDYWRETMINKALKATHTLRELGVDIGITFRQGPEKIRTDAIALLPDDTKKQTQKGVN